MGFSSSNIDVLKFLLEAGSDPNHITKVMSLEKYYIKLLCYAKSWHLYHYFQKYKVILK